MSTPGDSSREEILAEMAALARKLSPDPAERVNEEIASLREAVDSLRQQLAAQAGHGCCHHVCMYPYWHYGTVGTTTTIWPQTYTISTANQGGGGGAYYNAGGAIA